MADDISTVIAGYEDIAGGYEQMNRERMENYPLTRGGESMTITPQGTTRGGGVPGTVITVGTPPPGPHDRGRSGIPTTGARRYAGVGRAAPSGSQGISMGYQGPTMAKPEFQRPGGLKYGAYKPPEYDPGQERKLRQEYMAPGMGQVRKTTSQAMITSKSMDNPNTRSLFVEKALSGVGEAVSQIAGTAGREAGREARGRYQDEVTKYNTGWKILADETRANWDKEWDTALMQYKEQMNLYAQQPYPQQVEGMQPISAEQAKFNAKVQAMRA